MNWREGHPLHRTRFAFASSGLLLLAAVPALSVLAPYAPFTAAGLSLLVAGLLVAQYVLIRRVTGADASARKHAVIGQAFQLRRALDAGDIRPAFQPIFDLERGETVAYEVLARMRVNDTLIQAKDFIGVAQQLGLTHDMDLHVIREALACTPVDRALFLNIDLESFNDRRFIEQLIALLKPACARGRRITIEITERETKVSDQSLAASLERLRDLGCTLALDDFGSGYSTYKFLELFRPDYLKIEGSFVRDMLLHESSRKIVAHIHELATSFGIQTIAESVESASVEQALRGMGIRNAQGLHFGSPTLSMIKEMH